MRIKRFTVFVAAVMMLSLISGCGKTEARSVTEEEAVVADEEEVIEEEAFETATDATATEAVEDTVADKGGTGLVSDEKVKKGYVWMSEIKGAETFEMNYYEIAGFFGTDGLFDKEEYNENMGANYRYYKWISEEDDSVFLYVNFKESEDGSYHVSGYNTSGFLADEVIDQYLEELKKESE